MLIQFKTCNYKTFKEEATLSFIASNYDTNTKEEDNIYIDKSFNYRLLKSAVIYGANASGKSKLFDAYGLMRSFVVSSVTESKPGKKIPVMPFLFSTETNEGPSEFEAIFLQKGTQYRYGFEADKNHITAEWLYRKQSRKEVELFYRDEQDFTVHDREFRKGKVVVKKDMGRENALLVSLAAQFNEESATEVLNWFENTHLISGIRHDHYAGFSMSQCEKPRLKKILKNWMSEADFGIDDFYPEKLDPNNIPSDFPDTVKEMIEAKIRQVEGAEFFLDVKTKHKVYDENGSVVDSVELSMNDDESNGTDKFFSLSGPILDSLVNGSLLVVDELDTRLHPLLVCKIVSLFNSKVSNPKGAQLLFNTHDTNLLGSKLFRRDQVWFAEKDKQGSTALYSLSEFKGAQVRNDEDYRGNYLKGKYGAVPFLGELNFIAE